MRLALTSCGLFVLLAACSPSPQPALPEATARPSILLLTLDTTRADAIAPMPHYSALAARGLSFTRAYATAPMTLPSHASMLTGLYPAGHGVHENGRRLGDGQALLAQRLGELGYSTAAFVSGFPLARPFGLGRGFERYDDEFGDANERRGAETARRALDFLRARPADRPLFLWVHFYDPHEPYDPPAAFRRTDPYLGEIAAMDAALGQLLATWTGPVIVAGDHGEGRGEHGEALHGNLLYQGVMRVPLVVVAPGVEPGERREPVSLRQIFPTILGWAGAPAEGGLLAPAPTVVLGEAMQPYLNYRWQPQVMAVEGSIKVIQSGPELEVYDVDADPAESRNRRGEIDPSRALRAALADYPQPAAASSAPPLGDEARKRLASLGYVTGEARPGAVPDSAPHARAMTALLADLELGSRLFVEERYEESLPVHERVLRSDPGNLMVAVRLAVARSLLGRDAAAARYFERAARIDRESVEVRHYLAQHHLRFRRPAAAAPLFESVLGRQPDRTAAWEGLGRSRMEMGETEAAITAFEAARSLMVASGAAFDHDLELGVLYLAARRPAESRESLDRVDPAHPGYPMALFKRAQVSVLLNEPDRKERVRAAWDGADSGTRELISRERLFAGLLPVG